MKSLIIVLLLFVFNSMSGQKLINTIANEVCRCLESENKKDSSQDFQTLIEKCFQESMTIHSDALVDEYGEEILSDENTSVAYSFGVDLGLILAKECNTFMDIIAYQKRKENETVDAFFKQGQEKLNNGLNDEAIELLSKAISSKNDNYEFYNSRGLAYFNKAMYYEAISDFLKVVELSPSNNIGFYNIAYTKYQLKDYKGALTAINSSIKVNKDYCLGYNLKGLIHISLEEVDSSLVYFSKAFNCDSSSSVFGYNVGYSYYQLKEFDKALSCFQKSYNIDSSDLKLISYIGNCYDNIDDYNNAFYWHTKSIIRSDSLEYIPFYNRGLTSLNNGNNDQAFSDFTYASKLDSMDTDIIYYLAYITDKQDNNKQARFYFDRLIRLEPDNPNYYDKRAAFFEKIKEYDLAIRDYQFSLNLYPDDCVNYQLLGKLFLKIDKKQLANESFNKSVSLGCKDSEEMIQK